MGLFGASHFKTVLASIFLTSVITSASNTEGELKKLPFCEPSHGKDPKPSKNLVFISTLDGKVTALNTKDGSERWSLPTGVPLLSSSIHRLELSSGGQWVRLVPSLGGSLYRFSGDSLEPLPLSAEQLLSSSHKYSDDLVIAGGKETASLGVSTSNGQLIYECSLNGCVNTTDWSSKDNSGGLTKENHPGDDPGELLLIRRITQTVRAVEPRSGQERWNFSVGQHELSLQPFEGCILPPTPFENSDPELIFKVIVPEGIICAFQKSAPNVVYWKHKLNAPVVGAWKSDGGNLNSLDLFGAAHMHSDSKFGPDIPPLINPSIYIGMHDRQLYVQESVQMQALVKSQAHSRLALGTGNGEKESTLIIPWKPIPARSPPDWDKLDSETALLNLKEGDHTTTALSVLYASEYVNGNGYFLFTTDDRKALEGPTCVKDNSTDSETDIDSVKLQQPRPLLEGSNEKEEYDFEDVANINIFVVSFMFWWREVAAIAVGTAVIVIIASHMFWRSIPPREVIHRELVYVERHVEVYPPHSAPSSHASDSSSAIFKSRLDDFTLVQCLGRGGFGIVFEVKHNIDECGYAIKRIKLPSKVESRDRVLREVKALAALDHKNIVRYFNAWQETPPPEWEDPMQREMKSGQEFTDTYSRLPSTNVNTVGSVLPELQTDGKNVCISFAPELSINECYDALEYDKNKIRLKDLDISRQRSYSMSDSFSVFSKQSAQSSEGTDLTSLNQISINNEGDEEEEDDDSYIMFEHSKSDQDPDTKSIQCAKGESVISISDSDFRQNSNSNEAHNGSPKTVNTQIVCINESQICGKQKRGHRRNLSLDLQSASQFNQSPKRKTPWIARDNVFLYIQMELCQRESLSHWLRNNLCLDVRKKQVVNIFEQIVHAVEYVHLQGFIHRDLKPSNIFFSTDGTVKVGDFGLVTAMVDPLSIEENHARSPVFGESARSILATADEKRTQLVGTYLYMSPEQSRGESHGFKVDIWSLGLVLFELLIPFGTEMERVDTLKGLRESRFPNGFEKQFPQEHTLLKLMLSTDPIHRPSTLGVRARAPLLHHTDPRHHFCLPPRSTSSLFSLQ